MAKLIFYVHLHLLLDRRKLRALEACTYARKPDRLNSKNIVYHLTDFPIEQSFEYS